MRDPARVSLPPERLLDGSGVHEAVAAWQAAAEQHERLRRDRYDLEQRGLAEAIEVDRQADVAALEAGRALPKQRAAETKLREQIDALVRREQAAETIKGKAHTALLETLDSAQPKLAESAAGRREAALADYRQALGGLDEAVAALAEAVAFGDWAAEPGERMFKLRGVSTGIVGPTGDQLAVAAVIEQLRTVGQAPEKAPMPSPFGGPVVQPEAPVEEPTPAPAA